MKKIPEAEIAREARRILRALAEKGAALTRAKTGGYSVETGGRNGIARLAPEIFAEFRCRGWLAPHEGESFVLSDAGFGWLARALNPDTPFAAQHRLMAQHTITDAAGNERTVAVDEAESPLMRLRARGLLGDPQFSAGERLRRDFTLARLMPRLCADLSAPAAGSKRAASVASQIPDTVIAAKQRFDRAMSAVGPELSGILFDVCCHLRGLESAERDMAWPRHSAVVVLRLALDRLAAHYGLGIAPRGRARTRSWRMEGEALTGPA